jgi:dTDP-glucose 4,6-dehydratase
MVGDLADFDFCSQATRDVDFVFHLAAESHVDNSFGNSLQFTRSNTLGTHCLLEACRVNKVPRIIHVSTDEVYGEIMEGAHGEGDLLNPTNPYSASKAGADMMAIGYIHSFKMPITIVRGNNIFGTRQYPEKLIPRFTLLGLSGQKMPLHGNGRNRRRFLAVEDFADALVTLFEKGNTGEVYNVGTEKEYENVEIARMICDVLGLSFEERVTFVDDRPFNDFRYALDSSKMRALGWAPKRPLTASLPGIVDWYKSHYGRYASKIEVREVRNRRTAIRPAIVRG